MRAQATLAAGPMANISAAGNLPSPCSTAEEIERVFNIHEWRERQAELQKMRAKWRAASKN